MKKVFYFILMAVMGLSTATVLVACGDDDDDNNGGVGDEYYNGGGNSSANIPAELIGAWTVSDEQRPGYYIMYVFQSDGRGSVYHGVNSSENTAESVAYFTYSYNSKQNAIYMDGNLYTIRFENNNTLLILLYNNSLWMSFYKYTGTLPTIGSGSGNNNDNGGNNGGNNGDNNGGNNNGGNNGGNNGDNNGGNNGGGNNGGNNGGGDTGNSTPKPSVPTGLKAVQNGNTIKVTWNAASNAVQYQVWYDRPYPYNGKMYETTTNTYKDFSWSTMVDGVYTFYVVAVNENWETSAPSSSVTCNFKSSNTGGSDGGGSQNTKLDAPTELTASVGINGNFVQIEFKEVSLAGSYNLYRSKSPTNGYSKVSASGGSISGGRYILTDQNPPAGTLYYKVKAVPNSTVASMYGLKESDYSSYVKVVVTK